MANEEELQLRIHQLEKEIKKLHSQIKKQRYGLVWLDVPEAFDEESENKIPILEEVKEKAIRSDDGKLTHILIEGDNYHALECLNYTHRGKIDVIYIDPPYNTGSDGFTYKDKRILTEYPDGTPVPKEHPLRHSYWLSFMSKRLELAKNLLSDKGVIFISIDDNEQANLKLLCDIVFGEENFIADVIWNSRKSVSNDAIISINHNHTLIYVKNFPRFNEVKKQFKLIDKGEGFANPDNDPRGLWKADPFDCPGVRPNLTYKIRNPNTGIDFLPPKGRCWRTGEKEYNDFLADNRIVFGKTGESKPQLKRFLFEAQEKGLTPKSIWDDCGTATNGTQEIQDIFGNKIFDTPKPTELIKKIIQLSTINLRSSVILDFFAGSGTTMHAVMKLNEEDGGKRQCILVQQKEGDNNICENITYERNRRVMQGYTNTKGEQVAGLGNSMKYYKTAFVGKNASNNATDTDRVELSLKAGYLLALGENTLEEIITHKSYQIFSDEKGHFTAVYFTGNLNDFPEFVEEIEKFQTDKSVQIVVYIFCWGSVDIYENEFDNMRGITLKSIPQPILDIYKSINA
jgi:adenine-specific DNA-methyltransferase